MFFTSSLFIDDGENSHQSDLHEVSVTTHIAQFSLCQSAASRRSMDVSAHQRGDWAASPIPPLWTQGQAKRGVPSVDPAAHSRVRALPVDRWRYVVSDNQEHERAGDHICDKEEADSDGDNNQEDEDICTELKALPSLQLVAPEPRRVVSPELIFSSAAERYARHHVDALHRVPLGSQWLT